MPFDDKEEAIVAKLYHGEATAKDVWTLICSLEATERELSEKSPRQVLKWLESLQALCDDLPPRFSAALSRRVNDFVRGVQHDVTKQAEYMLGYSIHGTVAEDDADLDEPILKAIDEATLRLARSLDSIYIEDIVS